MIHEYTHICITIHYNNNMNETAMNLQQHYLIYLSLLRHITKLFVNDKITNIFRHYPNLYL